MRIYPSIIFFCVCINISSAQAHGPLDDAQVQALLDDLRSPDSKVQGEAALTLLKSAETLSPWVVRLAISGAVKAVGNGFMANPSPHLREILEGKKFDPTTRAEAALAIGRCAWGARRWAEEKKKTPPEAPSQANEEREFSSAENVQALLDGAEEKGEDIRVRLSSLSALGDLRNSLAIDDIKKILDDPQEDPIVKVMAGRALTEIKVHTKGPQDPPEYVTPEMMQGAYLLWFLRYGSMLSSLERTIR